jgi:hypothetical protein
MKRLICIFVLIITAFNLTFAQKFEYRVRAKNRQILISQKNKVHTLNLSDKIDAAKITETEILFVNRQNGFLYLVLDVSGQSKTKQDDRQCGAGIESNLIWIKLDANWKILDANSVRYESCWSSIANDNFQKQPASMSIEIEDFHNDLDIKLFYNADKPEKGFQITKKPLEPPK